MIHPTAIIDPSATIADDVSIGPYTIIEADVSIGEGTWVGSHVVIKGETAIGKHNKIYQYASLGEDPQDLDYNGEKTRLEIGDHNIIREFSTINRGSSGGEGVTHVGNNNFIMNYAHIAHDCRVGNHTVFANNAGIAGHVTVEDFVILGAFSGVHQFCRIGAYSFLGRATKIVKDIPPYMMVAGNPGVPSSLNLVGLKRHGFDKDTLRQLREAYKVLYRRGLTLADAQQQLKQMSVDCPALELLVSAIDQSSRGIARYV
ncbi:MAG: acyl-ACP--UDP-N-acetylglucosamine O-acyltransferase [Coxiellaceae bacterium]|nr:acyl-ACP--UDP-N-acetylglucosamine O-acyltransferase [Coxiellaceae bacterium]